MKINLSPSMVQLMLEWVQQGSEAANELKWRNEEGISGGVLADLTEEALDFVSNRSATILDSVTAACRYEKYARETTNPLIRYRNEIRCEKEIDRLIEILIAASENP